MKIKVQQIDYHLGIVKDPTWFEVESDDISIDFREASKLSCYNQYSEYSPRHIVYKKWDCVADGFLMLKKKDLEKIFKKTID